MLLSMLLAVDIGNTQIAFGLFKGEEMVSSFRMATSPEVTADQLFSFTSGILGPKEIRLSEIDCGSVASVVPTLTDKVEKMFTDHLGFDAAVIDDGSKLNFEVDYPNAWEIGADRLVNTAATVQKYGFPSIIVDFGTATTVDVIAEGPRYIGGIIAPGVEISVEALFSRAARLPGVDIKKPSTVIGRSTADGLRSGILYGFSGMTDSLVERVMEELGARPPVIATGGLAPLIYPYCKTLTYLDEHLTLEGLRILHSLNL